MSTGLLQVYIPQKFSTVTVTVTVKKSFLLFFPQAFGIFDYILYMKSNIETSWQRKHKSFILHVQMQIYIWGELKKMQCCEGCTSSQLRTMFEWPQERKGRKNASVS